MSAIIIPVRRSYSANSSEIVIVVTHYGLAILAEFYPKTGGMKPKPMTTLCSCCQDQDLRNDIDKAVYQACQKPHVTRVVWEGKPEGDDTKGLTVDRYHWNADMQEIKTVLESEQVNSAIELYLAKQRLDKKIGQLVHELRFADATALCQIFQLDIKTYMKDDYTYDPLFKGLVLK